ncbi:hypothetical protein [Deinococcus hopiensis]|uniref:hypothetical protein n=1 Tax=Deinococcus hopiensis TaxID=309885 RepID=UPI00111C37E7|nr:hypothetical protein [Deinococcus hopiensis]
MTTAHAAPGQMRMPAQPQAPLHLTYEARHQAALHQHASLLREAQVQQLLRKHRSVPWWSRVVAWRPQWFTQRLPSAISKLTVSPSVE